MLPKETLPNFKPLWEGEPPVKEVDLYEDPELLDETVLALDSPPARDIEGDKIVIVLESELSEILQTE